MSEKGHGVMQALQQRWSVLGLGLALLATYAVVVGALSVAFNLDEALAGEVPGICRIILGLWGLIGGILVWTGRRLGIDGWQMVLIWAVLQIPFIAWNTQGSPTTQLLEFPLTVSERTTVNGEVTSYSEFGVNLVGVVLTIWAVSLRERWQRRGLQAAPAEAQHEIYDIEHRAPDGAAHVLGEGHELDVARNAAASQAARLRAGGAGGEVVIIARPSGQIMAREELA
jgi:hypothetical protein